VRAERAVTADDEDAAQPGRLSYPVLARLPPGFVGAAGSAADSGAGAA
jgi:hypothetical protein